MAQEVLGKFCSPRKWLSHCKSLWLEFHPDRKWHLWVPFSRSSLNGPFTQEGQHIILMLMEGLARHRAQPWGGLVQGGFEDWRLVHWDRAVSGRYGAGMAFKVNWGHTMEAMAFRLGFVGNGEIWEFLKRGVRKTELCHLVEHKEWIGRRQTEGWVVG